MMNNLTYTLCGDYYIPNIKLSYTEPIEWNRFSCMARTYLKEHRPILYNDMILTEHLFPYLKEIGETAARRMEQLEAELLRANPAPLQRVSRCPQSSRDPIFFRPVLKQRIRRDHSIFQP